MPGTEPQIKAFMDRQQLATFCSVGVDGTPHGVPVWFTYSNGAVYVQTDRNSVKVRNLRRTPRACVVVYAGDEAVVITGRARLLPAEEFRKRTDEHIAKYRIRLDARGRDSMGIRLMDTRVRCVVEVRPDRVRYW